jgi:hypothetical protein
MPLVTATDIPYSPVPTGRTSPQAPDAYQRIPTDVSEFGALQGQALEKLGTQAEKFSTSIANVGAYQQALEDKTTTDAAHNALQTFGINKLFGDKNVPGDTGLYGKQGLDAVNAGKTIDSEIQAEATRLSQGMNQRQQMIFNRAAQNYRIGLMPQVGAHVLKENQQYAAATAQAGANVALQTGTLNWNNPGTVLEQGEKGLRSTLDSLRLKLGPALTPDMEQSVTNDWYSKYIPSIVDQALANNDPGAARKFWDANKSHVTDAEKALQTETRIQHKEATTLGDQAYTRARTGGPAPAGEPQPSQPTASKNLENFNFGNIKAVGGGWRTFASEEEGAAAVGDWLVRAQDQHGRKTTRELIERYAPSSDPGNAGKNLPEAAARIVGVDPDAPIDMSDPAVRRKMVGAIVQQEFGPQVTQRALAAYDRSQTGISGGSTPPAAVPSGAGGGGSGPAPTLAGAPGIPALGLPGLGPEVPAVPLTPAPDTPEGRYKTEIDRLNADPAIKDNPAALEHAIKRAEATYRSEALAISGAVKARKDASNKATDTYVQDMIKGNMDGIIEKIGADPRLDEKDRADLWALAQKHSDESAAATSRKLGPGYFDVVRRITLPDGHPERISSPSQVLGLGRPGPNGEQPWLTVPGVNQINQELKEAQGNDGITHMKNGQLAYAKQRMSYEEPNLPYGLKDVKGVNTFNNAFIPAFYKAYDDGIKAGKSPYQLLSKESPDYIVDKLIKTYRRSDAEFVADKMAEGGFPGGARTLDQVLAEARATTDPQKREALRQEAIKLGLKLAPSPAPGPSPPIAQPTVGAPVEVPVPGAQPFGGM